MVLLTAYEDFVARTLSTIPTLLGRLEYTTSLRTQARYEHWGLARVHGEADAHQAISRAHTELWLEVLRTPLPSLYRDLLQSTKTPLEWARRWREHIPDFLPMETDGGATRHFSSVLLALSAMSAAKMATD